MDENLLHFLDTSNMQVFYIYTESNRMIFVMEKTFTINSAFNHDGNRLLYTKLIVDRMTHLENSIIRCIY